MGLKELIRLGPEMLVSRREESGARERKGGEYGLNTASLEDDWRVTEVVRRIRVVEAYVVEGRRRINVEILEGPESGRVVSALSPSNLRYWPGGDLISQRDADCAWQAAQR